MFNLGFSEILIIGVMALLLIGPKQLPEMARVLGKLIAEFKKATADLSGGLLDIKNDLHQPFRDGIDNIHKIKDDVISSVLHPEEYAKKTVTAEPMEEKTVKININDIHPGESEFDPTHDGNDEPKKS